MSNFSWRAINATPDLVTQNLHQAMATGGFPPLSASEAEAFLGSGDLARVRKSNKGGWIGYALWTDPLGRVHCYLEAGPNAERARAARFRNGHCPPGPAETWPMRVISAGRMLLKNGADLLALCDCGAIGRPEQLCWMGERCGPCFDADIEGRPRSAIRVRRMHRNAISGLTFTPRGRVLCSGWRSSRIWSWNFRANRRYDLCPVGLREGIHAIAVLPDDLVVAAHSRHIVYWDYYERLEMDRFRHIDDVHDLVVSWNNRFMAITGDHRSCLINRDTGEVVTEDSEWGDVAFSADGGRMYATSFETETIVAVMLDNEEMWDTNLKLGDDPDEPGMWVGAFATSPTEDIVAVAEYIPRRFRLGDPNSGTWIHEFPNQEQEISSLVFSPDGRLLVGGDDDGGVTFWDVASRQQLLRVQTLGYRVGRLAFSPDGQMLAVGDEQGVVRVWPCGLWRDHADRPEPVSG